MFPGHVLWSLIAFMMLDLIAIVRIKVVSGSAFRCEERKKQIDRELRCCSSHKSGLLKAPIRPASLLLKKDLPLPGIFLRWHSIQISSWSPRCCLIEVAFLLAVGTATLCRTHSRIQPVSEGSSCPDCDQHWLFFRRNSCPVCVIFHRIFQSIFQWLVRLLSS